MPLTSLARRSRRGMTLPELIIGVVLMGIVSGALIKMLVVQGRFSETTTALRDSRSVSRDAYNIMMTDLRMVQDTLAIQVAKPDTITIRVPYAYGIVCGTTAGVTTVSLLPPDSAMYALATYGGVAYRDSASGVFQFLPKGGSDVVTNGVASVCADSNVTGLVGLGPGVDSIVFKGRGGRTKIVRPSLGAAKPGNPMFLWQEITYAFGPSAAYPNMGRGLYRIVKGSNQVDEIIAPFDTSAHFRFYVLNQEQSLVDPPANLNSLRGLDLRLNALSPRIPSGSTVQKSTNVRTAVYFKSRRDP
jgi:prepilin-type N-terminal cleavage/methylation domain-containing protein